MSHCPELTEQQTFDTRYAAAEALRSFLAAAGKKCAAPSYMPVVLSLYDLLIDDDDEVRDVAAAAASAITSRWSLPAEVTNTLLSWMTEHYGLLEDFRSQVVYRMIGGPAATAAAGQRRERGERGVRGGREKENHEADRLWAVPASLRLKEALRFDDSLFAVEKQNLFIDEVREVDRWAAVFRSLPHEEDEDNPQKQQADLVALEAWTDEGMQSLIELVASRDNDGPLGWTAMPDVFAVCARILRCSEALVGTKHVKSASPVLAEVQSELYSKGRRAGMHGSLLAIVDQAQA